jgi:hypothetical protein
VLGAELVQRPAAFAYRFGVHGPGVRPTEVARLPVQPGNSDPCFEWAGPIAEAIAHLDRHGIQLEAGPMERFGAKGRGTIVYFRHPDGSLMEFMSYAGCRMHDPFACTTSGCRLPGLLTNARSRRGCCQPQADLESVAPKAAKRAAACGRVVRATFDLVPPLLPPFRNTFLG